MDFGYSGIVTVRTHEVDKEKRITTPALLMLMQEASMQNVLELKASVWDMTEMQISWVLLRKELSIIQRPLLGEKIRIRTYPAGFDRVFAYRDFLVYNTREELLAFAGSTWTLINTDTRKMERIPKRFYSFNPDSSENLLKKPQNKLPLLTHVHFEKKYEVAFFDLDWNGHVNNNVLSRLILQSVPDDYLLKRQLVNYHFHIKAECFFKDFLKIQCEVTSECSTIHRIITAKDEKIIALAACEWK